MIFGNILDTSVLKVGFTLRTLKSFDKLKTFVLVRFSFGFMVLEG